MPFNTRQEIKTSLGIPDGITLRDQMIDDLLEEVHGMILDDVGGGLTAATTTTYTQSFDIQQSSRATLRLTKWPVLSVTSVYTGTNSGAAGSLAATSSYYVTDVGMLRLEDSTWPVGRQNVTVTWEAGFVPDSKSWLSLKLAEKATIIELFNTLATSGKHKEKIGSYSYEKSTVENRGGDVYPLLAARIVARFRTIVPPGPVQP